MPSSGGNDKAWRELMQRVSQAGAHVKVGILKEKGGDATYDDGASVLEVATYQEFGTKTIPERAPIRTTFAQKQKELAAVTAQLARDVVVKGDTLDKAHEKLGAWGVAAIKNTITKGGGLPPPLADKTIEAKGSSRPLVDTGQLLNSFAHQVFSKGQGK